MPIRDSLWFSFGGVRSDHMGVMNINTQTGLQEEPVYGSRRLTKKYVRGRTKPYVTDIEHEPMIIPVQFALTEEWKNDEDKLRDVVRWLTEPYFRELYFSSNINRRFFAMVVEEPTLIHNGLRQGYINLEFETSDFYSYSPEYITKTYDFTDSGSGKLVITNQGDEVCKPEIFAKTGNSGGSFSIKNITNGGQELKFEDLANDEQIYIDCENKDIISDIDDMYRYDNHNGIWLNLIRGKNNLEVSGDIKLRFRYRFKTLSY